MSTTAGIDVGSTYTKAVIVGDDGRILGRAMSPTGFRLDDVAAQMFDRALTEAGLCRADIDYVASTGYGRNQVSFRHLKVTDLTAHAYGARRLFPNTRTVLDVGGQTMKASRLDADGWVQSFRLNDKCAAGTGAFLEKTVRYMGYQTEDIGPLAIAAANTVPISGVCAVFAESEVINHLSQGVPASEIMYSAIISLVERSVQLLRRVRLEPEFTLVGGILRFEAMAEGMRRALGQPVNVPPDDLAQFNGALGAALLAQLRLSRLGSAPLAPEAARPDPGGSAMPAGEGTAAR
ncbi:2-hydroxyglutaryl-CoA dehydratase [bacterium]|nr:2-hydroxyglutaryl-CoA dehydratase [Chloroflexi bacterium CFX6]RIL12469.1 MAG: 2-hydroxyglutaryl-CoA dehydratase [bacterium]